MLCVFALSVAPTIFLHNTFASHTDSIEKSIGKTEQRISNHLFKCKCDHLVAESPFTEAYVFKLVSPLQIFLLPEHHLKSDVVCCQTIFYSLRGPPLV